MEFAQRLERLRGNVFADMDAAKARAKARGKEIIDLSLGSSDLPAGDHVLKAIETSLYDPSTHGYALFQSTQPFREAVATWFEGKYGVSVNPETEVLTLIGCQEGTAHLPLALLDPGDLALLQDPSYPSHQGGIHLAGGEIYWLPTLAENQFLPVFEEIPPEVRERAKMMVLSYPHNPTTALAPLSFFEEAVQFCQDHSIALVHDFPYGDMVFSGAPPAPSVLQADRQKEASIEFFTFSKSYNMGGFRIAFAVGNQDLILGLRQVKAVVDFNQYRGILNGAIAALTGPQESIQNTVDTFEQRRNVFVNALNRIGWEVPKPNATMYLWAKLPDTWQGRAMEFGIKLVEATGVAVAPGSGFGKAGEGYVRMALVRDADKLEEAATKIAAFLQQSSS
ncbi:LL-diaminopimelate aminotransferase [Dactylococcopsis salina]|uniref:Aspartate/tyrosine/aromatic aminotransferase n=1 Tax=Dactylococcopsis salina (strain PCC 8305) TaxID=13035 RepID=K9YVL2_DACS8|nr:LL-diaminopimelate aminotransferase [Dactylococcopsis salina]AFZ50966.1 aspartate/tyrosine/aromatic aminotransferase [Dactylococcopsis salina PCC 8305]